MSLDSGDIMPDSGQTGRNLARTTGSPAISPDPDPDLAVLAGILAEEVGSGQNGRTPGIWPDPAVLAESPASWPETG
jgi:hypothetical protein